MTSRHKLLPPVRDQGSRYTCLSIALSDGHHLTRAVAPVLSPEYLHWVASSSVGRNVNDGIPIPAAVDALRETGQPAESECPYSNVARPESWRPRRPDGPLWRRRSRVLRDCSWAAIESSMLDGVALVLVLRFCNAFIQPSAGWVAAPQGGTIASHAVLALELDPENAAVLVRNSWGAEWGSEGCAWLTSAYVNARCQFAIALEEEP